MSKIKYHFSLILEFEKDINVDELEKVIRIKAYRKNSLTNSLIGENNKKTAKLWLKSEDYENENTFEVLENYLISVQENFSNIKPILSDFNGKFCFQLVFNEALERPIIELTTKSIEILYNLGDSFSVDFI